jgi:hypothetical protein
MKILYKLFIFPFTKKGLELARIQMIQQRCKHESFTCDTQIRIIKCNNCGLFSRISDYKSLFK